MGKVTQTTLSKRNPYWIPKNRYYELRYFCLQYPEWKRRRIELDGIATRYNRSPTESEAIEAAELFDKIEMVVSCLNIVTRTGSAVNESLYSELLNGVTKGVSYDLMATRHVMSTGRELYYNKYREFFWLLNREKK